MRAVDWPSLRTGNTCECHFYWICDCFAIKKILEYDGSIPMICRWAQELLGYQFSVLHRNNRTTADVDVLTRRFGPLIAEHYCIAAILHRRDGYRRPLTYERTCFHSSATTTLTLPNVTIPADPIIYSVAILNLQSVSLIDNASIAT